jgi:hypothetical protein
MMVACSERIRSCDDADPDCVNGQGEKGSKMGRGRRSGRRRGGGRRPGQMGEPKAAHNGRTLLLEEMPEVRHTNEARVECRSKVAQRAAEAGEVHEAERGGRRVQSSWKGLQEDGDRRSEIRMSQREQLPGRLDAVSRPPFQARERGW